MKNASSAEKLSSTTGNGGSSPTEFAKKVKNLFTSSSPLNKKRSASLDALDSKPGASQMFGIPLSELCKREGGNVPFIVRRIVKHIEDEGMDQEGIYRVNGNAKVIERLKADFNRDGNADFSDVEIPAISSLLKLFLRELPGGVVPLDFVPHFAQLQQRYPSEATPEALDKLKESLKLLPTTNYHTLSYLIQHLTRVAKHSDKNKMTPISLSIVFGPNIFPCGAGIEGLKMQGYSNSTTCRMVQNYRTLFDRRRAGQKREPPERPQPYSEHKRQRQEATISSPVPMETATTGSTHDLECSHSERSIDEAIERTRSSETLSPTSPAHMMDDEPKPKASPVHLPPPVFVEPSKGEEKKFSIGTSKSLDLSQQSEPGSDESLSGGDQSFHRQYAKRGMRFKSRHSVTEGMLNKPPASGNDVVLRHPHLSTLNTREEELRTPSPYSWQSSPGTSPPTSPALTPRSSRIIHSVIDDTVKNYLFQSSPERNKAPKADVYGLLLPDGTALPTNKDSSPNKPTTDSSVQLRHAPSKDKGVVMRHSKKLRNRMSAVYGGDADETIPSDGATLPSANDLETSPIHNMNVKLVSRSPESSVDRGEEASVGSLETRQGKVSDLVKQFEEEDRDGERKSEGPSDGGLNRAGESLATEGTSESGSGEKGKRRKPSNKLKAFDMFEKSGIIMGMGGPPPAKPRAVSFASEVSTIPTFSTTDEGTPERSPRATLTTLGSTVTCSEDLTTVSKDFLSVSTCDEDVFTSPSHSVVSNSSSTSPSHGKVHRGQLGTTTSDDVFISPVHATMSPHGEESTDGSTEFDNVKRSGSTLEHLTLSRPKGPSARKRPRRVSAPPTVSQPSSSSRSPTSNDAASGTSNAVEKGERNAVKITVSDELKELKQEHVKASSEAKKMSQDKKKVNVGKDEVVMRKPVEQEQPARVKEERGRFKSAPGPLDSTDGVESREERRTAKMVIEAGEDMTDGAVEIKESKKTHEGKRRATLKETASGNPTRQRKKRHTVSGIDQLKTPCAEATISTGISRQPLVDLTSLAPENQQDVNLVTEGWNEGGGSIDQGKTMASSPLTTREIAHRIHELKSKVRNFEDGFTTAHGHKPSSVDKGPIRTQLEELNQLRKLYKELKEKEKVNRDNEIAHTEVIAVKSPTEPPAQVITVKPLSVDVRSPTIADEEKEAASSSVKPSQAVTRSEAAPPGKREPPVIEKGESSMKEGEKSSLQQSLDKIMAGLETRRKAAGRPDDPMKMTKEQIMEEKQMIQKALLSFEKTHGRPQTKSDKLVMKPLYDRYRQIKKLCSAVSTGKASQSALSVTTTLGSLPGLETTNDSLPSVTLLQSSMARSLPAGPPGYTQPDEPMSKSALELLKDTAPAEASHSLLCAKLTPKSAVHYNEELMSERQLQSASVAEARKQKDLLLARKKELRTILKEFESTFVGLHGRNVVKADRKPMQSEYDEYKSIKARLMTVDGVLKRLADDPPQKTI